VEENVEIANGVTMTFVLVPPGKFLMGSPPDEKGKNGRYPNETLHEVTLTEPFGLGKYEVTQAQYAALTGKYPSFYKGSDRPVEQVTWNEADTFGRLLTRKLSDRHVYRLATEAEWEYSCRGGRPSSRPFGVGDGRSLTPRDANFNNLVRETSKVGSYAANALGLCDMHGNVWEWCADWNEPYPDGPVTNPLRTTGGPFRVARGGCHNEPAPECRAALRQGSPEGRRDCWMGFRLARTVPSAGR
jgi:formylglycine-generating enzyme required for sulfatase activity